MRQMIRSSYRVTSSFRSELMKIDYFDITWFAVSAVVITITLAKHCFLHGLLIVFAALALDCLLHIYRTKSRFEESIPVYGEIVGYNKTRRGKVFPVLKYETEDGLPVQSPYSVAQNIKQFMPGDSTLICYFPDDLKLFYFKGREKEMYAYYTKLLVFSVFAFAVAILALI